MKRNVLSIILFVLSIFIVGCSINSESLSINTQVYNGPILKIAVVGEFPSIREKNIKFSNLQMENLVKTSLDSYDAIIITKEYLKEASKKEYADIYI